MHFVAWQKKLIRVELMLTNLDKKTYKYVIAKMFQDVNGASCGPNANRFKHPEVLEIGVPFCSSPTYIEILKHMHWTMRFIPHISTPKKDIYVWDYIYILFNISKMVNRYQNLNHQEFFLGGADIKV